LHRVWLDHPIYFVTTCTFRRRHILASPNVASILIDEWRAARRRHGWAIGRYVIMPDHVHFFCSSELNAKPLSSLMQFWKQWTSKRIGLELNIEEHVWQSEFFDHVCDPKKAIAKSGITSAKIRRVLPLLQPLMIGRGRARLKV
jgi:REP-associated tyrosine transposase